MKDMEVARTSSQVVGISIEQSRVVQEVQAQMIIAKNFERDEIMARAKIRKACERKSLAEVSQYVYPRGGGQITGPSIRLAEVLARCWTNINYGLQEISQQDGSSDVIAFAWDLETNTRVTRQFKVLHTMKAKGSMKQLTDPRDIYEYVANQGQRRVRACILEIIPGDVVDEAIATCERTLKSGQDPISDRIVAMVEAFSKLGVTQKMLEEKLGHPMKSTIEQELANLRKIYVSLQDEMGSRDDFFSVPGKKKESPLTVSPDEGMDLSDDMLTSDLEKDYQEQIVAAADGIPEERIQEYIAMAAKMNDMTPDEVVKSALEDPEIFVNSLGAWYGENYPGEETSADPPKGPDKLDLNALRKEFWYKRGSGFTAYVNENKERIPTFPEIIQLELREKWDRINPKSTYPVDEIKTTGRKESLKPKDEGVDDATWNKSLEEYKGILGLAAFFRAVSRAGFKFPSDAPRQARDKVLKELKGEVDSLNE